MFMVCAFCAEKWQELTPDEPCCCLAWALAKESADSVRPQQLSRLHAEIQKQALTKPNGDSELNYLVTTVPGIKTD